MKIGFITTLSFCFSLLICSMSGQQQSASDAVPETRNLVLNMRLLEFEVTPDRGLKVRSEFQLGSEECELVIRIPPGHWEKDNRSTSGATWYSFPIFFEPADKGREPLDRLLSQKFGKGNPATLFKSKGYSGSSYKKAKQFGRAGGRISVADAGIEGSISWSMGIEIDPRKHTLVFSLWESGR